MGYRQVGTEPRFPHPIQLIRHHLHARILIKKLSMLVNESPVETIPDLAPVAFGKITHFSDVV
jgi:hypothetical protein